MAKTKVFDLTIDDPSLHEILDYCDAVIKAGQHEYLATVNSELLQLSVSSLSFKQALDEASLRLCDGIGVQWAAAFRRKHYPLLINIFRALPSLLGLLFVPSSAAKAVKHRTTGRLLFEDLLKHAQSNGYKVFFLGGGPGVAQKASQKAKAQYPSLRVAGTFEGNPEEPKTILKNVVATNFLFVAYGSPKQELFIHAHKDHLQANLTIGVGGTFDAYVGAKPIGSAFRQIRPPSWVHKLGVESFWRLATQPNRFTRVWKSVAGLIVKVVFLNPQKP